MVMTIEERIERLRFFTRRFNIFIGFCIATIVYSLSSIRPHLGIILDYGVWVMIFVCLSILWVCYREIGLIKDEKARTLSEKEDNNGSSSL